MQSTCCTAPYQPSGGLNSGVPPRSQALVRRLHSEPWSATAATAAALAAVQAAAAAGTPAAAACRSAFALCSYAAAGVRTAAVHMQAPPQQASLSQVNAIAYMPLQCVQQRYTDQAH